MKATARPSTASSLFSSQASAIISSLLQKPDRGKMPPRLRAAMVKVAKVQGMCLRKPPMRRMSKVFVAWFTLPAPKKSSALKNAWLNRWKMAAAKPPTPRPIIM